MNDLPPDLTLLPALEALLEEASVTRAARRVGLSTPAMSHALARIRAQIGDPVLVRAGRAMVRTPRADAMRERVRELMASARAVLGKPGPFEPARLSRGFRVHATDHIVTVLGPAIDAIVRAEAPRARLSFLPNLPDDAAALREGAADLAVGVYEGLPPELRTRALLDDRFVCVVRADHPARRLTLERFCELEHVQIAPRGRSGGVVDDTLRARGLSRRVARTVPYFLAALVLVAETDYVVTMSERVAAALAPRWGLRLHEPPLPLAPYTLSALWHPRHDGDAAHAWLRDVLVRAAKQVAPGGGNRR
jgi:DNA-binding transcriptional LysR family regulator